MTPSLRFTVCLVALSVATVATQYKPDFNTTGPSAPARGEGDTKGGENETGPYDVVPDWPKPLPGHEGWTWGRTAGIWAESPDRVFVFQSGELPVLKERIGRDGVPTRAAAYAAKEHRREHLLMIFDREGRLVESWDQWNDLFVSPHSVKTDPNDPDRHVWLIDNGAQQVFKLTRDGKRIVMRLGEYKVAGKDRGHFGGPSDVAFLPNGDILVADGYQNSRVVKFDKEGRYLSEWGTWGSGPGQFNQLHGIAVDADQRIYVNDRVNSRVQIFDKDGRFLDQWPNIRFPLCIGVSQDQHVWVIDMLTSKVLKYDRQGRLLYNWGTFGGQPGQLWGVHQFSVDSEGNLYVAEVYNGRPQKFVPRRGADPSHLIGRLR